MCCRAVAVAVAAGFVDTQGQLTCACRFKRRRLTFAFGTGPSPPPSPSPELLPVRSGGEPSKLNLNLNRPRQYQYPPDEPRRPTKFTQEQLRVLSAAFDEDRFLKKARRMTLARQLGLTESSVQGWYASQILFRGCRSYLWWAGLNAHVVGMKEGWQAQLPYLGVVERDAQRQGRIC